MYARHPRPAQRLSWPLRSHALCREATSSSPPFLPSLPPHARARLVAAGCGVDTWSWPTAVLTGLAFQALAITLLIFYYADLWPTTWRPFLVQVGFLSADAVAHHRGGGGGGGGGGSGRQRKKHQKRG
eukprot:COSAG01_NODE_1694_length_9467_cov_4.976196_2_plen_128_part_00